MTISVPPVPGNGANGHPQWTRTAIAAILDLTFFAHHRTVGAAPSSIGAEDILRHMANYVLAQKTIRATYDTDIEIVTTELQKLSFGASGQVLLHRPRQVRIGRVGGHAVIELVYDGKTLSIMGKNLNVYAQFEAAGTLDQLVNRVRAGCRGAHAGVDALLTRSYADLTDGILDAKHLGRGVIGGIECDHLAFRTREVDWQLWIEVGPLPIPRKYIITYRHVAASPQYAIHFKDWRTDIPATDDAFTFTPPEDAIKVELDGMWTIDEALARLAVARS